jgi:hypothetical protein
VGAAEEEEDKEGDRDSFGGMIDGSGAIVRKRSRGEVRMKAQAKAKSKAKAKAKAKARAEEKPPLQPPTLEKDISLGMGVTAIPSSSANSLNAMNPMHLNPLTQNTASESAPPVNAATTIIRAKSGRDISI